MINEITRTEVSRVISNNLGINIAVDKWNDFEHKIKSACKELKIENEETFFNLLINSEATKEQLETLATHLTVGETYFFRETEAIEVFKNKLLTKLINQRKDINQTINIWSAGCCTGEEPYTIAMILNETLPDLKSWNINILATDINPHYLYKAKRGIYTQWSFRTIPDYLKNKYFKENNGEFKIIDEIKRMIHFKKLNLVEECEFPSENIRENSIDILFCRNVLMYFTPDQILNVANRFNKCITEGGWLITSPVEVSSEGFIAFNYLNIEGAIILEKNTTTNNSLTEKYQYISQLSQQVVNKIDAISPKHIYQTKKSTTPNHTTTTSSDLHKTPTKLNDIENTFLFKEALKYYKRNNYIETISVLNELIKIEPGNKKAIALQIQSLANAGDFIEARKQCEKYLETNSNDATFHYLLATILIELNEIASAEQALRKALYIDHSLVMAHFVMGNLLYKQGNKKASEKHFQNVLNQMASFTEDEIIPDTDGMTSSRMKEIINNLIK